MSHSSPTPSRNTSKEQLPVGPPATRAEAIVETHFGITIEDPYRWLEDQEAPEVREWIESQNTYTETLLSKLPQRAKLVDLMRRLGDVDAYGLPVRRGSRYFFSRKLKGQDLSCICMRQGWDGPETVLLDPHPLSADNSISVSLVDVSRDGRRVLYIRRSNGEDQTEVFIRDLDSGTDLPDHLPYGLYNALQFSPDGSGFYYVERLDEGPRLRYRTLGTERTSDQTLFGKGLGPERLLYLQLSPSGNRQLLMATEGSSGASDIYYKEGPSASFQLLIKADEGYAQPNFFGEDPIALTNLQAPNFKVVRPSSSEQPGPLTQWPDWIPENPQAAIEDIVALGGRLFIKYLEGGSSKLAMFGADGAALGVLPQPGIGDVSVPTGVWDQSDIYFSFTSFFTPSSGYRFEVTTAELTPWFQPELVLNTDDLAITQEWCVSADGARVPMFLVHRKDVQRDGNAPTLITGYGGFRVNMTPYFSSTALAWAAAGGVYVVAVLRGGCEFGETWHEQGMMDRKQNTFNDLFAISEFLIHSKVTRSEKLCVVGGSNGGLLVGAAITQRPELFKAAASLYPLHDMLRFPKFLMGSYWVSEYGNPESASDFRFLHAYSPYHQVRQGVHYPATIFVSGDADTRVAPLHARKMAAMVQAKQGGPAPILLQYDAKSGHSAGGSLEHAIQSNSLWIAFLMDQVGLNLA